MSMRRGALPEPVINRGVRTGDWAVLALIGAIAAYERFVRDDADLISCRVAVYRRHPIGRIVTDTVIIATALHLCEALDERVDAYHWMIRYMRRAQEPTRARRRQQQRKAAAGVTNKVICVTNNGATEDGTGRDIARHQEAIFAPPGRQ